jgi:predicted XRE-type DNA-binding protein
MMINNLEIRLKIQDKGLKYYEVARAMNIDPTSLSRLLRKELTGEKKQALLKTIDEMEGASK